MRSTSQQPALSLTAVIIAKNEEAMIANCIETLRWCDEILVIDNGSTDSTAAVAEKLGARVVGFSSEDFSQVREMGLKRVKTDWIMYIDADERITPTLKQEIAVQVETHGAAALRMKRETMAYGYSVQHGGFEADFVTRVFRVSTLQGWEGSIHESPVFEGEVLTLHTGLVHLTHRSTRDNLLKSADWTRLEAQLLYEAAVPEVTFFTLLRKGGMEFVRKAFIKRGYKDGPVGLIEALVQALNRVMVYIQVWELQRQPSIEERYRTKELEIAREWKHVS